MQVARWGNSLAIRIPAALASKLGLSEGSDIMLRAKPDNGKGGFAEEQASLETASSGTPNKAMVGKWGNSLGVRLPKALTQELGLGEGTDVTIWAEGDGMVEISKSPEPERKRSRDEALASFRQSRGIFTGSVKFPREDLQLRGSDVSD